jgi:hypothetical protein
VTIAAFFLYVYLFLTYFNDGSVYNIEMLLPKVFTTPSFYLSLLLGIILSLFPRFFFKFVQQYFWPTGMNYTFLIYLDTDLVQEYAKYIWKEGDFVDLDLHPEIVETGSSSITPSVSFDTLPLNESRDSWHRSLPKKLRKSLSKLSSRKNSSSTLIYLGEGAVIETRNTGYAFSKQDPNGS